MHNAFALDILVENRLVSIGDNCLAINCHGDTVYSLTILTVGDNAGQHHHIWTGQSTIFHNGAESAERFQVLITLIDVEPLLHGMCVETTFAE